MRALLALVLILLARGDATPRPLWFDNLTLWAWERPDDLRWLAGTGIRVALLDRTVVIRGGRLEVQRRRQLLRLAADTPLTAVVRIETDGRTPDDAITPRLVEEIVAASQIPRASAVQIDFDARRSERTFYSVLLREVRRRVKPPQTLSMTALASWCADDAWIDDRDVDEIVPMLFEMGPDGRHIVRRLRNARGWPVSACNRALGVSTGEPWPGLPPVTHLYVWRDERAGDIASIGELAARTRSASW